MVYEDKNFTPITNQDTEESEEKPTEETKTEGGDETEKENEEGASE